MGACSMYAIFFSVIPDWIEDQEKKIRRTLYFAGKMKKRALAIQAAREEAALAKEDKQRTKKPASQRLRMPQILNPSPKLPQRRIPRNQMRNQKRSQIKGSTRRNCVKRNSSTSTVMTSTVVKP